MTQDTPSCDDSVEIIEAVRLIAPVLKTDRGSERNSETEEWLELLRNTNHGGLLATMDGVRTRGLSRS
jgi:hypothetical protein